MVAIEILTLAGMTVHKAKNGLEVIEKIKTPSGDTVFDFGQNLVGWIEFKHQGKAGDTIRLYHAEILDKEGEFYTENLRAAKQMNTYILNGDPNFIYRPHFTFQGFRYLKIERQVAFEQYKHFFD